jgi:hypothetical protein
MGFVAGVGDLAVKDITTLSFDYDVVLGLSASGNTNLGNVNFIDCTAGAIRVEFELLDRMTLAPLGTARLYLGNDSATQFRSGCAAFDPSDLVNNQAARVDLSALFGNLAKPCCDTFKSFQTGQTGQAIVRKLALVVDHGVGVPLTPCSPSNGSACANYKVTFYDANVNGVTARSSLQVVTNVTRITDLVPDGVSIVITKLSDPSVPANTLPKVVKVIQNPPEGSGLPPLIVINGAKFTSSVKVVDIEANSGATYAFNLCLNSAEISAENPLTAGVARGICIPDQGIATLK